MSIKDNMKEIELFNKKVLFKSYLCAEGNRKPKSIVPKIKLTIKLTDDCNCNCAFCSNFNIRDNGNLDFKKLEKVIREVNNTKMLTRITITGGEPMLYPDKVNKIINLILSINKEIKISINTNGFNIKKFLEFENIEKLEAIHISRHHYDDEINKKIFKNENIATSNDIKYLQSKLKDKLIININTVLIKGYIDNYNEVKKIFNYVDNLQVKRIGFVALLKLNDYSKEHFVDFNEILKQKDSNFYVGHHFHNYNYCECIDGLYYTDNNNFIEFYSFMSKEEKCPYVTQLVYTTNNTLKKGFSGEIIY